VETLQPANQQLEDVDTGRLVTRIQSGDREAFALLYLRYFDRVYSYFKVALRDPDAAEELTQHVFVKVLDALPRYERRGGKLFRAWLFTIVRNETVREVRRRGRSLLTDPSALDRQREEAAPIDTEPPVPDWLSDRELVMFFERLPLAYRQVLMLRYMLNFSYGEIAAILDRSQVDVRSLHSRGLRFLRVRLGELAQDVPGQRRHAVRARVRWARVASSRRWALHS
jgi:RNA polymerase sigma-70 factor (ECF subfamily)